MRSTYKKLGPYVRELKVRNNAVACTELRGVSIGKEFMPSVANIHGTDLSKYKRVEKHQFAFNPMHVGRDEVLPIALLAQDEPIIVSPAYVVFEVRDHEELLPEYLMMWCRRPEFDRNAWFTTDNSVRGGFSWNNFCEMELPIPSIDKQREIVKEYRTVVDRIRLNERLNEKLEETAQAIYKQWFVEFEFPMTAEYAESIGKPELAGYPYKSSGGEMEYNDVLEEEIPKGWQAGILSDICAYSSERIPLAELSESNYLSTENMNPNRGGVTDATTMPTAKTVTKFSEGNILISNIRPYFKKIWLAEFSGGCSNDVLAIVPNSSSKSLYLYHVLEREHFFDYVMAGSKGTKMPRGDKDWIMNYPMIVPASEFVQGFTNSVASCSAWRVSNKRGMVLLRLFAEALLARLAKPAQIGTAA